MSSAENMFWVERRMPSYVTGRSGFRAPVMLTSSYQTESLSRTSAKAMLRMTWAWSSDPASVMSPLVTSMRALGSFRCVLLMMSNSSASSSYVRPK